jgi:methyl-accepting chemotaxis protein
LKTTHTDAGNEGRYMKKQLIRIFLLFGLIPAIILSIILLGGFIFETKKTMEISAANQLIVQRADKKSEVEGYLEFLKSQVKTYSANQMAIEATKAFKHGFYNYQLENLPTPAQKDRLTTFYTQAFNDLYKDMNNSRSFNVNAAMALLDENAVMLQDTYISNNSHPLGEKDALVKAGDYSSYDHAHQEYHPSMRAFLQEFGYYDIFIVDAQRGDIIYSVFKELDFATSLKTGPYANTGIAEVYQKAIASKDHNGVFVSDFKPYPPSYENPAAFIASPIYEGNKMLGVLIFQLPVGKLNELMTYKQDWANKGLGESGETYLVGPDNLMRSMGRFLIEDKAGYLAAIRDAGLDSNKVAEIEHRNSTVGLQPVKTEGVNEGLQGKTGFNIFDDYRGVSVLSAYAPIEVEGFPWVILSEIDEAEAYQPVYAAVTEVLIIGSIALALIVLLTIIVARQYADNFVQPLYYVVGSLQGIAKDIEAGHVDLTIPLDPPGNSSLARNMAKATNTMLGKFSLVLKKFSTITASINEASVEVARLSADSSSNMKKQYNETVQIATAITELSASASEVSNNANMAVEAASATDRDTRAGSDTVNSAAATIQQLSTNLTKVSTIIHRLEDDSDSIGTVLTVIQGIAEQTNLLALNAAIEAARAGEQGRGFAVVADEVRTLAARTQESTKQIRTIIEQLQSSSKEAVQAMDVGCGMASEGLEKATAAGNALTNIKNQVSDLDGMNALIANAAGEQSRVTESVNVNVNSISHLTEETAGEVEQSAKAAQQLQTLAKELSDIASQFKV